MNGEKKSPASVAVPPSSTTPATTTLLIPKGVDLLKESWETYQKFWKKFLGMMFVPGILILPLILIFVLYALASFIGHATNQPEGVMSIINVTLGFLGILAIFLFIPGGMVSSYGQIFIIRGLDKNIKVWQAFKEALSYFWRYLGLYILMGLALFLGFLALVIPGIVMYIWFSFAVFVLAFENIGGSAALKRSKALVQGFWWTVAARFVFWMILIGIVSLVLDLPGIIAAQLGLSEIGVLLIGLPFLLVRIALNLFIIPGAFIYSYLIYKNLKAVKEKNAGMQDGMDVGKKVGIVVLVIVYFFSFFLLGFLMPPAEEGMETTGGIFTAPLNEARLKARDAKRIADIKQLQVAAELYYLENEIYPDTLEPLSAYQILEDVYIDPLTGQQHSYQLIEAGQNYIICATFEGDQPDAVIPSYIQGENCWDNQGKVE